MLEVVVVCNGCTDDTAARARTVEGVRVVEVPEPSKAAAVNVGNRVATVLPRVHLDADVSISGPDILTLVDALGGDVHAAAPKREMPMAGASWSVRSYYRVWEALPQVRRGLFGRGVIALSAEGQRRVDRLPSVMSDDLTVSEAFDDHERRVVDDAHVVVRPPRTTGDLLRRRVRVVTGNVQATELGVRHRSSMTSPAVLARLAVQEPAVGLRLPVFLGIGLIARWKSRRAVRAGDFTTWLRDESSRVTATDAS
ncbi:glycosyltransferase family protein [Nocardioides sambongensis]|uniref:hypothetical protein n=1 Tax=Nocardioides sambongensis TaxID=2589074 RepID=UPI0018C8A381|nr:hypothetical protein [Nocardioides sambongensis]